MERGDALQILAVEDDRDFAALLKLLLKNRLAAELTIAEVCASARNILSASSFDLITLSPQGWAHRSLTACFPVVRGQLPRMSNAFLRGVLISATEISWELITCGESCL